MIWSLLGVPLNLVSLRVVVLALVVAYGTYYGVTEALGISGLRAPGSRWQVPQPFVIGKSRRVRVTVWGFFLGPGFATRNPYAGFWMLPLVVATVGSLPLGAVFAGAVGAAHAAGRALALVTRRHSSDPTEYLNSVIRSMRWRVIDGYVLLVIAALAVVSWIELLW